MAIILPLDPTPISREGLQMKAKKFTTDLAPKPQQLSLWFRQMLVSREDQIIMWSNDLTQCP